ncbi:hypothetical protein BEH94_05750 [Candidatus Altiarchaeales archaeon WOR_SM1_SCG]|nr:hypothetical protein BEH94_05750 [Candidatus Altiarchaeales archaeon WOR_SM1_SCG]
MHENFIGTTYKEIKNGWNLTFWNGSVNCRDDCLFKDYHYFLVYENGSVIKVGEENRVNKTVRIWTDKLEYQEGEVVNVYVWNGLDVRISGELVHIDQLENTLWHTYLLASPCELSDAYSISVDSKNKIMTIWWQQIYLNKTDCGGRNAPVGTYRFRFEMGVIKYSNEFKIIE